MDGLDFPISGTGERSRIFHMLRDTTSGGAVAHYRKAAACSMPPLWDTGGDVSALRAKPAQPSPGVLSESGTLVVNALMSGEPVTIAPLDLIAKCVVAKGFFLNHPDVELKIPSALRETAPLVASGVIRVPIAATYPLARFREAVAHVQRVAR